MVHVLIVEDDEDIRDYMSEIVRDHLREKGLDAQVDTAVNGAEGLKKLKGLRYDLILTDLRMPTLSGGQMVARKSEPGSLSKDSPVVVITGNRDEIDVDSLKGLDFVEKPLLLPLFYKTLEKYLPTAV